MAERKQWYETLHDQFGQYLAVDSVLHYEKTDRQDLITFENAAFSRVMALDGIIQTTGCDRLIYHETMTHIPLLIHGYAKHVLIIGGGDGVMLHEVTRHRNVESVMMAEIDAGVISFRHQYLSNRNAGNYDDPHLKLVTDDGANSVNQTSQTPDTIISDCTDLVGPGESLFTSVLYEGCKRYLNPGGIFVTQSGVCFLRQREAIDSHRKLGYYFSNAGLYQAATPIHYGGAVTFARAADNDALRHLSTEIIQARFLVSDLKCHYHDPVAHTAVFALPQYLQSALTSQPF